MFIITKGAVEYGDKMKKKFIIGGIILLIPIIFLAYLGFKNSLTYYYQVDQLLAKGSAVYDKNVRVSGRVQSGIEQVTGTNEIRFTIIDIANRDNTIPVVYSGVIPDTFQEGGDVIVEGKYTRAKVFQATSIVTKCASKYIPAGVTTGTGQ
jgi:cytochrome c-type biogenesis protein CcmE